MKKYAYLGLTKCKHMNIIKYEHMKERRNELGKQVLTVCGAESEITRESGRKEHNPRS